MTAFPLFGPVPQVVILDIFYRESILVLMGDACCQRRHIVRYLGKWLSRLPSNGIQVMFSDAGFRPGNRGPFVSAKGPHYLLDTQQGKKEKE